jgi:hypothetical protein
MEVSFISAVLFLDGVETPFDVSWFNIFPHWTLSLSYPQSVVSLLSFLHFVFKLKVSQTNLKWKFYYMSEYPNV